MKLVDRPVIDPVETRKVLKDVNATEVPRIDPVESCEVLMEMKDAVPWIIIDVVESWLVLKLMNREGPP